MTNRASRFDELLLRIGRKAPLQKKRLMAFIDEQPGSYRADAEKFVREYERYLEREGLALDHAVDAYVEFCNDLLACHVRFLQTRKYPTIDATTAYEVMYSNPEAMKPYMIGLAISLFLWRSHYEMYRTFRAYLRGAGPAIGSYLEIGPGHGAYLAKALEYLPANARVRAVDISETSLSISRGILETLHPARARLVEFVLGDVTRFDAGQRFDFVTMGEVLEHVNAPDQLLHKIHALLTPNGTAFVTTCANAPTVDHVYHFHDVHEIRTMIEGCSLRIEDERVLPAEPVSLCEAEKRLITVNYCALLRRA